MEYVEEKIEKIKSELYKIESVEEKIKKIKNELDKIECEIYHNGGLKNVEKLKIANFLLESYITECANKNNLSNDKIYPMYDGIYDSRKYLNSKIKIMWILKEPYDDFDQDGTPCGGYYGEIDAIFDEPKNVANPSNIIDILTSNKTLGPVARMSYGILTNQEWQKVNNENEPMNMAIANCLQEIAFINLSKMPAKTKTEPSELKKCYKYWKEVLLKQIKIYNPNVIIFGYTFYLLEEDIDNIFRNKEYLYHKEFEQYKSDLIQYTYGKNPILVIDTYHPNNRFDAKNYEIYANQIIKDTNTWFNKAFQKRK